MSRYLVSPHPQGTPEWKKDRAGRATGSRMSDALKTTKTGWSKARTDYAYELANERVTGQPIDDFFMTEDMKWGIEQEPFARMAFEAATGYTIRESGFFYMPDIMAGCSVDGLIEVDGRIGIWESKSPKSTTHFQYIRDGKLPDEYRAQVIHNMWVTGADFAYFSSYDPRMAEHLQLFGVLVRRNAAEIAKHEADTLAFLREVDDIERELRGVTVPKIPLYRPIDLSEATGRAF